MLSPRTIRYTLAGFAVCLALLALSACSLAGDVTPPPNYRPPTPEPSQAPTVQTARFPQTAPDPVQGQAIFAQKCQPCHGDAGLGDGPQAANLPNQPAPIGSFEMARSARLADWFAVVTNGKLDNYMPNFSGSLNDAQRWDVIAYVQSLSMTSDQLAQGKTLYAADCAACHGDAGKGDGPQASKLKTKLADWTQQSRLADLSDAEIADIAVKGQGEMPGLGNKLDETQRWALAVYVRTLGFANPDQLAQLKAAAGATAVPQTKETLQAQETAQAQGTPLAEATPQGTLESTPAFTKITIQGKLTNGTSGGKVPASVKVSLLGFDSNMTQVVDVTSDTGSDGSYQFKDVAFEPGNAYMLQTTVNSVTFNSDILHGSDIQSPQVSLPIQVYDTSTDTSQLKADRMHVFFDFSKPGSAQVVELFIISNPTDRVIVPKTQDSAVLDFELPDGATNLQFQDSTIGQRYVQTAKGFGDRQSITPGQSQHQVLFAYEMPYTNRMSLSIVSPLPVDAAMVMVPQSGIKLTSSLLADAGDQAVQGMTFRLYQSTGPIGAGQPVSLELSGSATGSPSTQAGVSQYAPLIAGAGIFLIVLGLAAFWLIRARQKLQPAPALAEGDESVRLGGDGDVETSDALVEAIVALEDQYKASELSEAAYKQRRADLKERLAQALAREK